MRLLFLIFALLAITAHADPRKHAARNVASSVNRVMRSLLQATDAPTTTPDATLFPTDTPTADATTAAPSDTPTDTPTDSPTDSATSTPTDVATSAPTNANAPTDSLSIVCNNTVLATQSLIAACWNTAFVYGILDPTSPSFNTTNLNQFCNSTCVTNTLPNLKTSVENDCGSYLDEYGADLINTPDRNYLAQLDVMMNVFCFAEGSKLTVDGIIPPSMNMTNVNSTNANSTNSTINYCYGRLPLLLNTSLDIFNGTAPVNYTNLNRVCATGCEDFASVISLYADPTLLSLLKVTSTVCLKEPGSRAEINHQGYCVPYALTIAKQLGDFPDETASNTMITSYLDNTCDICMRSFFQTQISLAAVTGTDANDSQQAVKLLGAFCQQWGPSSTYCLVTEYQNYNLIDSISSPQVCGSVANFNTNGPLFNTVCPASCKVGMRNVSNAIGCCFPSFLSLITSNSTNPQAVNNWMSFITNNATGCNVSIATQCSEQFYDVTFDVYNIDSTKFNMNTTAKQATAMDVAVSLGLLSKDVDPNIIVSTPPTTSPSVAFAGTNTAPKVTLTARVRPPSNRQANRTQTILNSHPQLTLTQLNRMPSIRADALKPTLVNSSSLSYNVLANTVVLPQISNITSPTSTPIGPTGTPTAPSTGTNTNGTTAAPSTGTNTNGTTSAPTIIPSTGTHNNNTSPGNMASNNNSPLALLIAIVICVATMLA